MYILNKIIWFNLIRDIKNKKITVLNKIVSSYLTDKAASVIPCAEILIKSDWSIECFARINRPPCQLER